MPELPEVETIRRQLAPLVRGRLLTDLEVIDPRWTRPRHPREVADAVAGRRIESLNRRGKYLIWSFEDDITLLVHLRMTGNLLYDGDPATPHTRVRFVLDDGHALAFVDPRRFGTGELTIGPEALESFLAQRLGPEPFDLACNTEYLRDRARGSRAPIKAFLLDQRRIAGVGNIYADEALFRARIHPLRRAGALTRAQFESLRLSVIDALNAGIAAKGATIDDFRHLDGARGSFQDLFMVHRREGEPCPNCGTDIVKLVVAGRGTYVCRRCQPGPRGTLQRTRQQ